MVTPAESSKFEEADEMRCNDQNHLKLRKETRCGRND